MKKLFIIVFAGFMGIGTLSAQDVQDGDIFAGAAEVGVTTGSEGPSGIRFLPRIGLMLSDDFALFADLSLHNINPDEGDGTTTTGIGLSGRKYFDSNFFGELGLNLNAQNTNGNTTSTYGVRLKSGNTFLIGNYAYVEPGALLDFGFGENVNTINFGLNVTVGFHLSQSGE